MCDMAGRFAQGHMPIIWNVCIAVILVALLIAVIIFHMRNIY